MVLGIKELEARIVEKEGGKLKAFERRIDEALERSYVNNSNPIYISISSNDPKNFVRDEILNQYKMKGWDVRIIYDQRDGDSYKFSPKRQRSDFLDVSMSSLGSQENPKYFGPYGFGVSQFDR